MRYMLAVLAVTGFVLAGCEAQYKPAPAATAPQSGPTGADAAAAPATGDPAASASAESTESSAASAAAPAGEESETAATKAPVPVVDGVATLSPDNTKIQFVGLHSPPNSPQPRTGGFAKFSGQAKVDPAAKTLQSVAIDIDTTSLFTSIGKLTDHLKSGDFFEVNEYPTAKFESTQIVTGDADQAMITGNLTLHGVTKEISLPATVAVTDEGLTLASQFKIDRTQFGMTFGKGQVEKDVALTVVIGEKTVSQ